MCKQRVTRHRGCRCVELGPIVKCISSRVDGAAVCDPVKNYIQVSDDRLCAECRARNPSPPDYDPHPIEWVGHTLWPIRGQLSMEAMNPQYFQQVTRRNAILGRPIGYFRDANGYVVDPYEDQGANDDEDESAENENGENSKSDQDASVTSGSDKGEGVESVIESIEESGEEFDEDLEEEVEEEELEEEELEEEDLEEEDLEEEDLEEEDLEEEDLEEHFDEGSDEDDMKMQGAVIKKDDAAKKIADEDKVMQTPTSDDGSFASDEISLVSGDEEFDAGSTLTPGHTVEDEEYDSEVDTEGAIVVASSDPSEGGYDGMEAEGDSHSESQFDHESDEDFVAGSLRSSSSSSGETVYPTSSDTASETAHDVPSEASDPSREMASPTSSRTGASQHSPRQAAANTSSGAETNSPADKTGSGAHANHARGRGTRKTRRMQRAARKARKRAANRDSTRHD